MSDFYEMQIADLEAHISELEDDNRALKEEIKDLISVIENSEEKQDSGIAYRYITRYEDHLKELVK